MDKLRLLNYRCLEDTGKVELRPITILLGANSSGKSSFLKFFPLLQQSVGTTVNGMFLWDGPMVDFKDFENTVKDGEGEIIVEYQIEKLSVKTTFGRGNDIIRDVCVQMTLCQKDDYYDYLRTLTISYDQVKMTFDFDANGQSCIIKVNSIDSSVFKSEKIEVGRDANLLPSLRFLYRATSFGIEGSSSITAAKEMRKFLGKEDKDVFFFFDVESDKGLKLYRDEAYEVYAKSNPLADKKSLDRITDIHLYYLSSRVLTSVNTYFSEMAKNFSYVLPLRSIMNRYYRFQNRDVDQIDPDGDNLAMFLNSLSKPKLDEFNKWLRSIFHFSLNLHKSEGHVEILIEEEGKELRNLVDVGFGYTQILPIITIIWKSIYGKKTRRDDNIPITIAIEQPELHLHPRFQAHFAQMLAAVMGYCHKHKILVRIIIETHSEVIVNKLGQLIEASGSGLKAEDVNVVLFNAKTEGMDSYVHAAEFSNDGFLNEWPYGFFSDDVY